MPGGSFTLIYWVLIIGVFYVFLIRPEKKKQKQMQSMLQGLKVGDNVITRGGIIGRITVIEEDALILETGPDKIKLSMSKYSIGSVLEAANEEAAEDVEVRENDDSVAEEIKEEE